MWDIVKDSPSKKGGKMAGTANGGRLAAQKNKKRYGSDFYARIGRMGGQRGNNGGFAAGKAGRERARYWGAIGGSKSRRNQS